MPPLSCGGWHDQCEEVMEPAPVDPAVVDDPSPSSPLSPSFPLPLAHNWWVDGGMAVGSEALHLAEIVALPLAPPAYVPSPPLWGLTFEDVLIPDVPPALQGDPLRLIEDVCRLPVASHYPPTDIIRAYCTLHRINRRGLLNVFPGHSLLSLARVSDSNAPLILTSIWRH